MPAYKMEKSIRKVFAWLNEHGLSVYGPNIDPEDGAEYEGLRDFTADDAMKVCRLLDKGQTWSPNSD